MKMCKNDGNKVDMRQYWTKGLPWKIMKNYVEKKRTMAREGYYFVVTNFGVFPDNF